MGSGAKKTGYDEVKQCCNTDWDIKLDVLPDQAMAYCPHCSTVTTRFPEDFMFQLSNEIGNHKL